MSNTFTPFREAMVIIPHLMDNPLYEGAPEEARLPQCGFAPYSLTLDVNTGERSLPGLSGRLTKTSRRQQAWSLSSHDYEAIWRVVQGDVGSGNIQKYSMSPLEEFKQFRQKLADLKQVKEQALPTILAPLESTRSMDLARVSTRSSTVSSRPTSPLKRLSVLSSRKGMSALNPQRDTYHLQASVAPSTQRPSVNLRAEGALISAAAPTQLPNDAVTRITAVSTASRRRLPSTGDHADVPGQSDQVRAKPGHALRNPHISSASSCTPRQSRTTKLGSSEGRVTCTTNANEVLTISCTPKTAGQQLGAPKKKSEKVTLSCSPGANNLRARCIHIPRPMCYTSQILE